MTYKPIFITGIGTEVGKTVCSAIWVEMLRADYWKPVQSGDLHNTDTMLVKSLVSNKVSKFHPEAYRLTQPFSPHKSAAIDGIRIDPEKIVLPATKNRLIIEGAGGLLVPLNENFLMIDLIEKLGADVILVSKNYLGSINHTLMSAETLRARGIKISKLVFCGERNENTEQIIYNYLNINYINIPVFRNLNKQEIKNVASQLHL